MSLLRSERLQWRFLEMNSIATRDGGVIVHFVRTSLLFEQTGGCPVLYQFVIVDGETECNYCANKNPSGSFYG